MIVVPGLNSLIENKGVLKNYLKVLKGEKYKVLDISNGNIKKQLTEIFNKTENLFNSKIGFLGGDHSISYPLVMNFFKKYGKNSKLIVFDAHPDLMEPMPEPTHEEWLRAVVENGFLPGNIIIVGIRRNSENVDSSEISYAKSRGIKIIYSDEFNFRRDEILDFSDSGKVYVSVDADVLDSSVFDLTGYPETNGFKEKEFLSVLSELKNKGNVYAYDLVEINFEKGETGEKKGKKILRKILKTLDFD